MDMRTSGMLNLPELLVDGNMRRSRTVPAQGREKTRGGQGKLRLALRPYRLDHRAGDRRHVERIAPHHVVFAERLGERRNAGCDDRRSARDGLNGDEAEALLY